MKICIIGSRGIENFDLGSYIPQQTSLIITGGARGVDTLAEEYANKNGISKLVLRPDYRLYGRAAPLKRNENMIDLADAVLVVWDGKSKGSAYAIRYAKKTGKPMTVIQPLALCEGGNL